jgi:hypothetical protein
VAICDGIHPKLTAGPFGILYKIDSIASLLVMPNMPSHSGVHAQRPTKQVFRQTTICRIGDSHRVSAV